MRPKLYNLFIWMHYFAAKDNPESSLTEIDFAHEATWFLTWHRLFMLWFEREIQIAIDDPEFTFSYWDWTKPEEHETYFKTGRLNVSDSLFNEWDTYCWPLNKPDMSETDVVEICSLTVPSNRPLRRCPSDSACMKSNPLWPSHSDVNEALQKSTYDAAKHGKYVDSFLEGFVVVESCSNTATELCDNDGTESVNRKLHNTVSYQL